MDEDRKESWFELCARAAQEQDPLKLMALIAEIDRLLAAEEQNPKAKGSPTDAKKETAV